MSRFRPGLIEATDPKDQSLLDACLAVYDALFEGSGEATAELSMVRKVCEASPVALSPRLEIASRIMAGIPVDQCEASSAARISLAYADALIAADREAAE